MLPLEQVINNYQKIRHTWNMSNSSREILYDPEEVKPEFSFATMFLLIESARYQRYGLIEGYLYWDHDRPIFSSMDIEMIRENILRELGE